MNTTSMTAQRLRRLRHSSLAVALITCGWTALFGQLPAPAGAADTVAAVAEPRPQEIPSTVGPKVLAFYYPWYGNPDADGGSGKWSHWREVDTEKRQIASSTHYPVLGAYDSQDPKLIAQHCQWAKQAGVDALIVSWWGQGTIEDQATPAILDGCRRAGLMATVYFETVPNPKTAETAARDIVDVLNRYGRHPAWLKVDDKPVIFIYGRAVNEIGLKGWQDTIAQVKQKLPGGAVFMGDKINAEAARIFDGLHTYNPAGRLRDKSLDAVRQWSSQTYPRWVKTARGQRRISAITVIPGYDDTKIRKPGLRVKRFGGQLYSAQWQAAIAARPDWILITSWNEWHEGSEIEPSVEDGQKYLKLTRQFADRFKTSATGHER